MDSNYLDMNNKTSSSIDDEHDVIILDDDDFIQTTFNLFSSSSNNNNDRATSVIKTENNLLIDDLDKSNSSNISNQQNSSILIDLTTCNDFDLNDFLLMHSSQASASSIGNMNNLNQVELKDNDKKFIKNEFDFKIFNFNFENSIEEILIDDDDDDDGDKGDQDLYDDELELASDKYNQKHSTNLNMPSNMPNYTDTQSASFIMYRTNDSGSETSSIKQSKKTLYKCEICSKTFNKSFNYKRHLFLQHESKSGLAQNENLKKLTNNFSINECQNCKKRILDRSNFNKHVRLCNQKMIKNNFKNLVGKDKNGENLNDRLINKRNTAIKKNINKHICEICNKEFNKKFNFHRHIRMHFLNEIMNHQHDPLNNSNRSSPNFLNSNYKNENNLNIIEFYQCETCLRKFNEHKQLVQHKTKWHLTEYDCKYCKKKFLEKFDYIKHVNSEHNSVKFKFECNYCKKSFKYLSQYIQHRRTHFLNNNFNMINSSEDMDIEVTSNNINDLGEENYSVADEKLISCEHCGRNFTKNFNLKRHIESKHNKNKVMGDNGLRNMINSDLSNSQCCFDKKEKNVINVINTRTVFDCNLNQKKMYKNCKINHHLNKFNLN